MSTSFEISDRFTDQWADLSPFKATEHGITGRDHLLEDFSIEGHERRHDLYLATRRELSACADSPDDNEAFGARVLLGWLDEKIDHFESKRWRRDLNHIESPFQGMRDVFDVMPNSTAADWDAICSRLEGFSWMLGGYRECLASGIAAGDTVASRQAESLLEQLKISASSQSSFLRFVGDANAAGVSNGRVGSAVEAARAACDELAGWLASDYLPHARSSDAVGREEYLRGADEFLGMSIDVLETYEWGWGEIDRIRAGMAATASEIDADKSVGEIIDMLEHDPARSAATRRDFVEFVSGIQEQAIDQLSGEHFDVPDPLKTVTVNIAPPGGSLGAWYVSPSEDFSRPGSIWYAPGEREHLPYWQEVSTAYHEGFPGHHLQVGTAVMEREKLTRFHRSVIWCAGAGEGWALYAERLMDELGFFEKPEYRLGLLASQLFRSARVVVDIGCQLELEIPAGAPLHAGETWDYHKAVDYMHRVGLQARDIAESEVKRYLGWWGQAISYKVGEREILDMRDQARTAAGFDLKSFHRRMLEAGAIRLDHLREVMA